MNVRRLRLVVAVALLPMASVCSSHESACLWIESALDEAGEIRHDRRIRKLDQRQERGDFSGSLEGWEKVCDCPWLHLLDPSDPAADGDRVARTIRSTDQVRMLLREDPNLSGWEPLCDSVPLCYQRLEGVLEDGGPAGSECQARAEAPIDDRIACASDRWLGALKREDENLTCSTVPVPEGWSVSALFGALPAGGDSALLSEMRSYCQLEWEGPGVAPQQAPSVAGGDPTDDPWARLTRSCYPIGVASEDPTLWPRFKEVLRAREQRRFDRQAGRPVSFPDVPAEEKSNLFFIDTKPDPSSRRIVPVNPYFRPFECPPAEKGLPLCSDHGLYLQAMARRLLCDPPTCDPRCDSSDNNCDSCRCLVDTGFLRGLEMSYLFREPGDRAQVVEVKGGSGSFGGEHLATVIQKAIDWGVGDPPLGSFDRAHERLERIVINLSLGWNGERFGGINPHDPQLFVVGGLSGDDRFGFARPIYLALEYAACHGALVIAAAGNYYGGKDLRMSDGPLLPAGWADRSLEVARCPKGSWAARQANRDPDWTRPLIWAAGGLGIHDRPLFLRGRAMAPRLGFAQKAVVELPFGGWTDMLTGTSVGSMVVASAAAALWSLNPGFDAKQVMETLDNNATRLGQVYTWENLSAGTDQPVEPRKVTVCETIQDSCAAAGAGEECLCTKTEVRPLVPLPVVGGAYPKSPTMGIPCLGYEVFTLPGGPVPSRCPHTSEWNVADVAWSGPTPGGSPCESCGYTPAGSGHVFFVPNPDFTIEGTVAIQIQDLMLLVEDEAYYLDDSLTLSPCPTMGCPTYTYPIGASVPSDPDAMALTMTAQVGGDTYSITVDLLEEETIIVPE